MKYLSLILFFGFYVLASPFQILKAISEVNKYQQIKYDYQLHNDLINFSTNGSWYYSTNNMGLSYHIPSINRTRTLSKDFLMFMDPFKKYREMGYEYLFSDTVENRKYPVAFIIKFRNKQLDCFDWSKCSRTSFDEHTTCLKNKPVLVNSKKCSYAFTYLPKYIGAIRSIACILLNFVSPYTPTNQALSFACYYIPYNQINNQINTDYPF